MSAETGGSGESSPGATMEASSAATATIAVESVGSSFGPSDPRIESFGSYSPTSLPSPDIPSSPISEISRPESLTDADFLPELQGEFTLADIVGTQSEKLTSALNEVHVDPATSVQLPESPTPTPDKPAVAAETITVHETKIEQSPQTEPNIESTKPLKLAPDTVIPFSLGSLNKNQVAPEEAQGEKTITPDSAIASITTGIITLQTVEPAPLQYVEQKADAKALEDALAELKTYDLENQHIWAQKLQNAAQMSDTQAFLKVQTDIQVLTGEEPLVEIETAEETALEAEAQMSKKTVDKKATATNNVPPPPFFEEPQGDDGNEPEKPLRQDEYELVRYEIDEVKETAKDVNNNRQEVFSQISADIRTSEKPKEVAEQNADKLDGKSVDEAIEIAQGRLEIPDIAYDVKYALRSVDEKDAKTVEKTVSEVLSSHQSTRLTDRLKSERKIRPQDLAQQARELLRKGADKLIYKKLANFWEPVKKLPFKNPYEVEVKKKAA